MNEILSIGNPIVDIFINVDEPLIHKYDITTPVQHIDREKTEALLKEPSINLSKAVKSSGGGAANVAKIAAMLGIKSVFTGCIGDDEYSHIFYKEMSDAHVENNLIKVEGHTGICFICNAYGETRIMACPGAALLMDETYINEEIMNGAEAIAVDGFILDRRKLVKHILKLASKKGIPVALDVASVFQVRSKAEEILTYARSYPLFVFMNADEAITFFNTIRKSSDSYSILNEKEKEAMILRDVCPMLKIITDGELFPVMVIKLGSRGAVVVAGGHIYHEETFSIIPKDAVGAGDAFCAAFISAWIRGKSLSECASIGNKVAREILEVPGTKIKPGKLKSFAKILKK